MTRFALTAVAATLIATCCTPADAQVFRPHRSQIVTSNFTPFGSVQTVQVNGPLRHAQSIQAVSPFGTLNSSSISGRRGVVGAQNTQVITPFGAAQNRGVHGLNRNLQQTQTVTPFGTSTTTTFNGPRHSGQKTVLQSPNGRIVIRSRR